MVDAKEQTRIAIAQMVTYIQGLEHFDGKQKLVFTLIDLEWSLRKPEIGPVVYNKECLNTMKEILDDEEFKNGHEEGWNT